MQPSGAAARDSSVADAARIEGWFVTEPLVDDAALDALSCELDPFLALERGHGGVRNLLDASSGVRALAQSRALRCVAESVLGDGCVVVRALLFDKTPEVNWKVVWHQDLTIAVAERREVVGYGPWSEKAGVVHVQPPIDVLEQMLAVRVHLDDCGVDNGPVRVLSGTHRSGRLSPVAVEQLRAAMAEKVCTAPKGAVLAFHPLLLHASSPATVPGRRRVVHFEFASSSVRVLAGNLAWRWSV
jgi:ectoine hydroxylase-related dioxygenase (phytanoyl-CoA dioxygenase family)